MFSHVLCGVDLNFESSTNVTDRFDKLSKLTEQSHLEYEEAIVKLDGMNKEITENEEKLEIIERERVKLMSELAMQMQTKHDLKNKVEVLKNTLQSTEFDLKKYNKMKLSTVDLETFARIKKIFLTYKNILKIYFDYSNGADGTVQRGYMYNRISKKLAYFEFNKEKKTAAEISGYLWNKMKLISDKNWEIIDL